LQRRTSVFDLTGKAKLYAEMVSEGKPKSRDNGFNIRVEMLGKRILIKEPSKKSMPHFINGGKGASVHCCILPNLDEPNQKGIFQCPNDFEFSVNMMLERPNVHKLFRQRTIERPNIVSTSSEQLTVPTSTNFSEK
jgi:hypothetical protein